MSYITGTTNYDCLEDAIDAFSEYTEGQAELVLHQDGTATIYRLQDKPAQPGQAPFKRGLQWGQTMNTLSEVEAALDEGRLRVKVEAGFLPATRLSETKWDETGRYWLILIEVVPATIARLYISSMPGSPAFRIEGRQN